MVPTSLNPAASSVARWNSYVWCSCSCGWLLRLGGDGARADRLLVVVEVDAVTIQEHASGAHHARQPAIEGEELVEAEPVQGGVIAVKGPIEAPGVGKVARP